MMFFLPIPSGSPIQTTYTIWLVSIDTGLQTACLPNISQIVIHLGTVLRILISSSFSTYLIVLTSIFTFFSSAFQNLITSMYIYTIFPTYCYEYMFLCFSLTEFFLPTMVLYTYTHKPFSLFVFHRCVFTINTQHSLPSAGPAYYHVVAVRWWCTCGYCSDVYYWAAGATSSHCERS